MHLTRYYMYTKIKEAVPTPLRGKVLGISGISYFLEMFDQSNIEILETEYPQVDMQRLPFGNEEFDLVISDQVIEHLADPKQAFAEAFRVLKVGGLGIHTTCFLNPIHYGPKDYFRFSCDGLIALCPPSVEVIESGSWGNRLALLLMFLHDPFFRFLQIPERRGVRHWLAMYNEAKYPIVTWIVGQKMGK